MISNLMAAAAFEEIEKDGSGYKPYEIAQTVVNAAWKEFIPEDKSTWPKDSGNGKFYLVMNEDNEVKMYHFYGKKCIEDGWTFITHYADPNDLLHVHVTNEKSE